MENLGGEVSFGGGGVGVGESRVAEFVGVAGGGYEEVSGPGPTSGGGTGDW